MYRNVDYVTRSMLEKLKDSVDQIRMHFRGMLRGMVPFSWAWDGPETRLNRLQQQDLMTLPLSICERLWS